MRKILIVTPRFPFPVTGACEQDRLFGILQLKQLGHTVRVLTKCVSVEHEQQVKQFGYDNDISITTDLYSNVTRSLVEGLLSYVVRMFVPVWWDGAAYEFRGAGFKGLLKEELNMFQPDVVWFDYSFLWQLYDLVIGRNIPIVTRSINFEPTHFLEEEGRGLVNYLKYWAKIFSEYMMVKKSDVVLSINPNEGKRYARMGARHIWNLPLRGLRAIPQKSHHTRNRKPLRVAFMGSTFNVNHNKGALEFILKKVIPNIPKNKINNFSFHITGSKLPKDLESYFKNNVIYEGFVENLDAFLDNVDIAIIPSLSGAGMQQKIFEPLYRGIPTITHERGIAGYPFNNNQHLMFARSGIDFANKLVQLADDSELRKAMSKEAQQLSWSLFDENSIDATIIKTFNSLKQ